MIAETAIPEQMPTRRLARMLAPTTIEKNGTTPRRAGGALRTSPFSHTSFHRFMALLAIILLLLSLLLVGPTQSAFGQVPGLSGGGDKPDPKAMELLLDEARKNGSTVIMVTPGKTAQPADTNRMSTDHALEVRAKVRTIVQSASTLWPNIKATINKEGPNGSFVWALWAAAIAIGGLVLAWLATRPVTKMLAAYFRRRPPLPDPQTTADKARFLLLRVAIAVFITVIYFLVATLFAVAFDPGTTAARRLIFEIITGWSVYRLLRYGVSWNLMAYDAPKYRLLNLTDEEASAMHRDWWMLVIGVVIFVSLGRFLVGIGFRSPDGTFAGNGALTLANSQLLYIIIAAITILALSYLTLRHWSSLQRAFTPRDTTGAFYPLRRGLAMAAPPLLLAYGALAFMMFVYRVALLIPDAGGVIAGPFVIAYVALISYGLVLLLIQSLYNRRERLFYAKVAEERERQDAERAMVDTEAGEDMTTAQSPVQFEYQPIFRGFFESAALAIIAMIALGQLGHVLNIPGRSENGIWSIGLDVVLSAVLCWIAYRAVSIFVDRRLEEEGGVPEANEEEIGGEGGGAGATRMATLLPIMRYALVTVIFFVAGMVILSRLGVDIAPIFAGAGVVGIAVGFGAQTLIRDIFSGAFFLMDDAFRKGEYLEIEGIRGTVEKISIRSFQLRHHLGALHTLPFGEIKQLTNYSRDWVLMKLPLRVTYDTDVERVRKLIKKLGQQLLEHPQVGHTFMQPLKSQGVYRMEDSAMIIRVKFMTKPGEQFVTRKVVYESIQELFAREGIQFAHKEVTVRLADKKVEQLDEGEKKAVSAAARSVIDAEEAATAGKAPADGGR
ncbi:MAG: mechanosensitive ion channel domain-containing protein [Pseudomonadota bacterium]